MFTRFGSQYFKFGTRRTKTTTTWCRECARLSGISHSGGVSAQRSVSCGAAAAAKCCTSRTDNLISSGWLLPKIAQCGKCHHLVSVCLLQFVVAFTWFLVFLLQCTNSKLLKWTQIRGRTDPSVPPPAAVRRTFWTHVVADLLVVRPLSLPTRLVPLMCGSLL